MTISSRIAVAFPSARAVPPSPSGHRSTRRFPDRCKRPWHRPPQWRRFFHRNPGQSAPAAGLAVGAAPAKRSGVTRDPRLPACVSQTLRLPGRSAGAAPAKWSPLRLRGQSSDTGAAPLPETDRIGSAARPPPARSVAAPLQSSPDGCSRAIAPAQRPSPPAPGSGRHTGSTRADTRPDRLTDPVVALHHLAQNTQEALPIFVVLEDRLAPVATGGDVIQGAGKFDAQGSGHAETLTEPLSCRNTRPDPVASAAVQLAVDKLTIDEATQLAIEALTAYPSEPQHYKNLAIVTLERGDEPVAKEIWAMESRLG